jgi:hypothetical protein
MGARGLIASTAERRRVLLLKQERYLATQPLPYVRFG